jgi:hypothetical protein
MKSGAPRLLGQMSCVIGLSEELASKQRITPRAIGARPITAAPITAAGRPLRPIYDLNRATLPWVLSGASA